MRKLQLGFLLALFFSISLAQAAPADGGLLTTIFNIDAWTQEMSAYTDVYQQGLNAVAYSLAIVGFIASVIGVLMRGSLGGLNDVFLRLFMVSAILAATPQISTLALGTWQDLRDWSGGEMQTSFTDGAAEMQQLGADASILALGLTGVASGALRVSGAAAAQAAAQGASSSAMTLLNAAVIPVAMIAFIAHFIILGAGVAVLIGCAFLPVAAGMLAFSPMQGGDWLGRIVGTVVSALVVTAFMPLIFKAGFDLMVVQPIAAVNAEFREFGDFFDPQAFQEPPRLAEIERERQRVTEQMTENVNSENFFNRAGGTFRNYGLDLQLAALSTEALKVRGEWTLAMLRQRTNALEAIAGEVKRWFVRLVILFIAAFMASGLTWWGARSATGLVGGVVGGKIGALALSGTSFLAGKGGGLGGAAPSSGTSAQSGSSGSSYHSGETSVTYTNSGGPSGGGGRSYSPPANASATSASTAGATTASFSTSSASGRSETSAPAGGTQSATPAPKISGVDRT